MSDSLLVKVDSRVGSRSLEPHLRTLLPSHTVRLEQTRFADVSWSAQGPEDSTVRIGVELKTVPDLLSSLESRRLVEHQLPGLIGHYNVVYLIVEGLWRPHISWSGTRKSKRIVRGPKHGLLEYEGGMAGRHGWLKSIWRTTGWQYENVAGILCGFESKLGVRVLRTSGRGETLMVLAARIGWWAKGWDAHKSAEAWMGTDVLGGHVVARRPSIVEKVAAILPGVGQDRARHVALHFETIRRLVNAPPADWVGLRAPGQTVSGRRHAGFTKQSAEIIQKALDQPHGGKQ